MLLSIVMCPIVSYVLNCAVSVCVFLLCSLSLFLRCVMLRCSFVCPSSLSSSYFDCCVLLLFFGFVFYALFVSICFRMCVPRYVLTCVVVCRSVSYCLNVCLFACVCGIIGLICFVPFRVVCFGGGC